MRTSAVHGAGARCRGEPERGRAHTGAIVAATFLALSLAGCVVDGSGDEDAWRSVILGGLPAQAEPPADGEPLGLVTALRLSATRHPLLSAPGEDYARALLERRRAAAAFLPRIDFVPSGFLEERTGDDRRSGIDLLVESRIDANPLSDLAEMDRAAAAAETRRARLLVVQDGLLLDSALTFVEVVRAERQAEVLRASLAVQQARVEEARGRVEAGVARPLDVALSESRAADARVQIVDSETRARAGRAVLAFLLDAEVGELPLALDETLVAAALGDIAPEADVELRGWIARAHRQRQELLAAHLEVAAARATVESAYGQWWPSVALDLDAYLERHSGNEEMDWASAVDVRIPLFSAGVIEVDVRQALSLLRESLEAVRRVRSEVARDVTLAHVRLTGNRDRVLALQARRVAAERSVEQAQGLWDAGLGTNLERLAAQDELLSAELDLVGAITDEATFALEALRATGDLHRLAGLHRAEGGDLAGPR